VQKNFKTTQKKRIFFIFSACLTALNTWNLSKLLKEHLEHDIENMKFLGLQKQARTLNRLGSKPSIEKP
jgi:hypothetical protein